jgi:mannitol/fructose-specific phosphotransferase system IIA component (Ntr-type)
MKHLVDALNRDQIFLDVAATDMTSAIQETVQKMVTSGILAEQLKESVIETLLQRERDSPTIIGNAVAIPHAYLEGIEQEIVLFVRLSHPVNMGAPDGIATQFLFFLLGPPSLAAQHLDTFAYIARLTSDDEFRFEAGEAGSAKALRAAVDHFAVKTQSMLNTGVEETDGLKYTGRLFGGLRKDITRRWPHYLSDFTDGLHSKCAASTLFLFFACLAPAVTFGAVMAVQTAGEIGVVEMIVASVFCGIVFALVAGQPLVILGGTGPLLVFTAILYQLCNDLRIPFLPTYGWIGLWSAGLIVGLAITDASCLMRFFTRFTDEIFSALISIIFIFEAVYALTDIFQDLDIKKHHDTALLSLLLALGTFYVAMTLSRFRRSNYLLPRFREFLADFGPAIAITVMTLVSILLHEVFLDVMPAPESFGTTTGRDWVVNLWEAPVWVRCAAFGPALFVTVLVFLDQNITARIVNSRDHRLHKGEAYHLDLGIVGLLIGICSFFGLPWLVAATVRSLNHVRSLATVEEIVDNEGEPRNRVLHVRENRLTGFTIHLLLGFSLFFLHWLKLIPMAVLYGLFLFMGVVSMSGNQFFERLSLWLRDPTLYPATHYIRRVPRLTIHAFTLVQLLCLGVLWYVKGSAIGILFPVFIALLVPVRQILGRFFTESHLAALDAEEEPDEEESHWAV